LFVEPLCCWGTLLFRVYANCLLTGTRRLGQQQRGHLAVLVSMQVKRFQG